MSPALKALPSAYLSATNLPQHTACPQPQFETSWHSLAGRRLVRCSVCLSLLRKHVADRRHGRIMLRFQHIGYGLKRPSFREHLLLQFKILHRIIVHQSRAESAAQQPAQARCSDICGRGGDPAQDLPKLTCASGRRRQGVVNRDNVARIGNPWRESGSLQHTIEPSFPCSWNRSDLSLQLSR